jgi:HAE1 family hydrophobic/amphiphilic exporter-1
VFRFVTLRPIAVAMAFIVMLAFGWKSLGQLPMSLLPDINYPTATVRAEYPGAAPEDVEERVTERLHETLSVLPRLESISSISRAGLADVTLNFAWGTELTYAIQDIRERLDRTILPLEVETPIILRYDPTLDPILTLGLTGGADLIALRRLAEDVLAPKVSTIDGVAAVRVRGGLQDEIQVRLQPDKLANWGLRAVDIAARLAAENVNLASGTVLEGDTQYLVRILNEYRTSAEIGRTILMRDGDSIVRLTDVADVARTFKKRDVITRIGGEESVELQVFKEADANIVDLARRVRMAVFGTKSQQDWVAKLRTGAIEDPDARLEAFRDEVAADPEKMASMERITKRRAIMAAQMQGGRGGGGGGGQGGWQMADDRTEEQKALDEELSARLDSIRSAQRDKADNFAYEAANLPADVNVHLMSDQSRFIESALDEVRNAGLFGAILAVLVLFLFLRLLSTTLIIAIAIPVSVMVSFTPLHLSGTSLNVMSLGGLALGIGMLVDNAIVVLESIARYREEGHGRLDAAVNGVREVSAAVTASTLTTVAVFAPIVFVEGIAGQIFRDQALTVVVSLLASLVVALFLVPMLASRGREGAGDHADELRLRLSVDGAKATLLRPLVAVTNWRIPRRRRALVLRLFSFLFRVAGFLLLLAVDLVGRVIFFVAVIVLGLIALLAWLAATIFRLLMYVPGIGFRAVYGGLARGYPAFIHGVVSTAGGRAMTVAISVALLAWTLFTIGNIGSEMLPQVHQGELVARLNLPVGTPLAGTEKLAAAAEQQLRQHPDVNWVAATVGVPRDEIAQPDEGEHSARISIGLKPNDDMEAAEERVMADLRDRIGVLPELRDLRFERPTLFSIRSPIMVEIKGDNLAELAEAARAVEAELNTIPGLRDVRSSVQPGSPEVMLSFDRDLLSRYGLDSRQLATAISNMVQGTVATRFSDAEHKLDVLVQVDKAGLTSLEELMNLPADPGGAAAGPLAALSNVSVREGPREIIHIWGQRAAVVSAGLSGFDVGRATDELTRRIAGIEATGDLTIGMGGQSREMQGALGQMTQALLLAVFLVYVVMASIFESLLQPLIILVTVPLALVGAVTALWALDMPLSVVVFIGAIILAGIVVNNAIVLIDAINRRRRIDGMALHDAVREACAIRLRPILMTTLTTVLGLLPLTGWLPWTAGEGTELRAPMAVTVVAGLSVATLLTLIVIPTVYVIVESALERSSERKASLAAFEAPGD